MRRILFFLFLLFLAFATEGYAGDENPRTRDYSIPDSIALHCTKNYQTTSELTYALIKNLSSDEDKFRAIFRWITHNVAYSFGARNAKPKDVMKRQRAVCQGYSELLREMCLHASLKCELITGFSKVKASEIGKLKEMDHAWNAIRLGTKWYLVDATWAAGYVDKRKFTRAFDEFYYLANPNEFMYSHYPEDPKWFLTDTPISKKNFERLPVQRQGYFQMGTHDVSTPKGLVRNRVKYEFTTTTPVFEIQMKLDREKEYTPVEFTEENGIYAIDIDLKDHTKGDVYLFFNNDHVLTFYRK